MNFKGQVSVEFIIVLMLLFSLFLFSLWVFGEKNETYIYAKENHEAKLLANKLARTVNSVYLAGNGTEARVLVERNIDFNVSAAGRSIIIGWRDNYVDAALLTDNITLGQVTQGNWVNVKNINGGVRIENA